MAIAQDRPQLETSARLRALLEAMRPAQWIKNAFVLAGIVFSGRVLELDSELRAWGTFVAFCLMSSAAYLVNDIHDRETDRLSPRTAGRPIARGALTTGAAWPAAAACGAAALGLAAAMNGETVAVLAGYGAVQLAYSTLLKHVLFVDVMAIAAGFMLRALAGTVCIDAVLSPWLFLVTFLLALCLGLTKRRSEVVALGDAPPTARRVLAHYPIALLDELIAVVTPCIVMVYAVYAVLAAPSDAMLITLPFVIYGVFRVLYLIHHRSQTTQDPSVIAVLDRPMLACIVLWGITACVITVLSY